MFELGKTYELKQEWKAYFDAHENLTGERVTGFYYVKPVRFPEPSDNSLAYCQVYDAKGKTNPLYASRLALIKFDWVICEELKIYLITCGTPTYETYEGAVVIARSEEEAKSIHPDNKHRIPCDDPHVAGWTRFPENVKVTLLGNYEGSLTSPQVILASFVSG